MILLFLSVAWLAGLALAAAGHPGWALAPVPLAAGAAAAAISSRRPGIAMAIALCAALCAGGALWFQHADTAAHRGVAIFDDQSRTRVRGIVDDDPEDRGATQRFRLKLQEQQVGGEWRPAAGTVLATTRPFPEYAYGDRLELTARLETPPTFEGFDYREYLARRGVGWLALYPEVQRLGTGEGDPLSGAIIAARSRLGAALSGALPEPEAALARGMLLGQRAAIPRGLTDDFNRAGISHLIAISGSNVSLVAALAVALLRPLAGRRPAVLAAMACVFAFVLLVGASPPVLRAGVMGVVMLGAILAGRPGSGLTALAFAAAGLTALQPLAILDVAFQLSFAATAGLIVLAPLISRGIHPVFERFLPPSLALGLSESIAITAAAGIAVFPITAANFERVSLVAIPANIVAVPLFGMIIVTSGLTAAAGIVSAGAAGAIGRIAELPLWVLIEIARAGASIPGASLSISGVGTAVAIAFYASIGALTFVAGRRHVVPITGTERLRIPVLLVPAGLTLIAAAVVWIRILVPDGGDLRVTVLDIGQGDAILIETPAGRRILVDGGPSGPALLNALDRELPSGSRSFDLVVLTHPQEDHVAGLVTLSRRFEVGAAAVSGSDSSLGSYQAWLSELDADGTPVEVLEAGEVADLGGDVRIEVLGPPQVRLKGTTDDLNANSVVLRLTYGSVSFLLTGDLSREGEEALLAGRGDVRATVLKVGHHGSDGSSSEAFISAVHPAIAVISAGANNTYGHPSPTTLLHLTGVPLYRTDRNGAVHFRTDGRRIVVKADRGSYQLVPVSAVR